jgi:hypothetical protein
MSNPVLHFLRSKSAFSIVFCLDSGPGKSLKLDPMIDGVRSSNRALAKAAEEEIAARQIEDPQRSAAEIVSLYGIPLQEEEGRAHAAAIEAAVLKKQASAARQETTLAMPQKTKASLSTSMDSEIESGLEDRSLFEKYRFKIRTRPQKRMFRRDDNKDDRKAEENRKAGRQKSKQQKAAWRQALLSPGIF